MHRLLALCVIAVFALMVVGCGKVQEAADTAKAVGQAAKFTHDMQDGKAKIKGEDGKELEIETKGEGENMTMKMTGEDGEEVTISGGENVDLTGLDLELYPGATKKGGHNMKTGDGESVNAVLQSNDPFDKIADFYKSKYPDAQKNEMDMDGNKMLMLNMEEPPVTRNVTVTLNKDEEGVQIILTKNTEKKKPAE